MTYVELHCHSAYSFLDGASHPEELAARAAELGYETLALTDHDGVYGSLEFAHAAKAMGLRPITGAEVTLEEALTSLCWSRTSGDTRISAASSPPRTPEPAAPAGEDREPLPPAVSLETVSELNEGLVCLSGCARQGLGLRDPNAAARLAHAFGRDRFYVELQRPFERGDARRNMLLRDLAEHIGVDTIATGDVHAHDRKRTLLQDVLVAIRCRTSLDGCEPERRGNRESFLRPPEEMVERFAGIDRAAAERTGVLAERLEFDLTEELGYRYPDFSDGPDPAIPSSPRSASVAFEERYSDLNGLKSVRASAWRRAGADRRARAGRLLPAPLGGARACARGRAGRARTGLAATFPAPRTWAGKLGRLDRLLPDRPLSRRSRGERPLARPLSEPGAGSVPDIDLDFPRDIREKLIVAVTERYGREHAALVASFSDVPFARRDPRRGQGARAPLCGARAARASHRRLERETRCR